MGRQNGSLGYYRSQVQILLPRPLAVVPSIGRVNMTARIYKPARTAMQSGAAKTKEWVLDYEPEQPRAVEPLMGWTSSGDMKQQLRLLFDTKDEAVAYCERNGIAYQVFESQQPQRQRISYSDNFAYTRRTPWTH
jgi:NADH dehydrogenase ubiquinone Fe-S protein 4